MSLREGVRSVSPGRRALNAGCDATAPAPSVAGSEVIPMTGTSPIERVVLTHLQIPLKEPFRISGGEVAIKDAILVTVETSSGIAHGESSPMAASFGYSADTPEGCWDDLESRIAPSLIGKAVDSPSDI